jgi:hypothetical protein
VSERRTRKAIRILEQARDLLREKEWVQNSFYEEPRTVYDFGGFRTRSEGFCAIGAVNRSVWGSARFTPRTPAVITAIRALGKSVRSRVATNPFEAAGFEASSRLAVIRYNDKWAYSKSQVLGLFFDAIERLNAEVGDTDTMEARIEAALSQQPVVSQQQDVELAGGPTP